MNLTVESLGPAMRPSDLPDGVVGLPRILKQLGLCSRHEILLFVPIKYVDCTRPSSLRSGLPAQGLLGPSCVFDLNVLSRPKRISSPRCGIRFLATDGSHSVEVTHFADGRGARTFPPALTIGDQIFLVGSVQAWAGNLQISDPIAIPECLRGSVVPLYQTGGGPTMDAALGSEIRRIDSACHREVIREILSAARDPRETELIQAAGLESINLTSMLRDLHGPTVLDDGLRAARDVARVCQHLHAMWHLARAHTGTTVVRVSLDTVGSCYLGMEAELQKHVERVLDNLSAPAPMRYTAPCMPDSDLIGVLGAAAVQKSGRRVVIIVDSHPQADELLARVRSVSRNSIPAVVLSARTKEIPVVGNPILICTRVTTGCLAGNDPVALLVLIGCEYPFIGQTGRELFRRAENLLRIPHRLSAGSGDGGPRAFVGEKAWPYLFQFPAGKQ